MKRICLDSGIGLEVNFKIYFKIFFLLYCITKALGKNAVFFSEKKLSGAKNGLELKVSI